jgi:phosphoglycolate phosphatase
MSHPVPIRFGARTVPVRAIAFDKDGTLIESQPFWHELWGIRMQLIADLAGADTAALWEREVGATSGVFDRRGPFCTAPVSEGRTLLAGLLYRTMHWSWDTCREQAAALYERSNRLLQVERVTRARTGAKELIRTLKHTGVSIGIVTSDSRPRAVKSLELLGFPETFWDFFFTASDGFTPKPAPDMVLAAAERVRCHPEDIAVVGDSVVDARMAKASGSFAVSVPEVPEDAGFLATETDVVLSGLDEISLG